MVAGKPRKVEKVPLFSGYSPEPGAFDEFFQGEGEAREDLSGLTTALNRVGQREFRKRQLLANSTFLNAGVTFSVYSDTRGAERVFPFDLIPRVITASQWESVERGLTQRVLALNAFLSDIYGAQRILKEKVIPSELCLGSSGYFEENARRDAAARRLHSHCRH